MSLFMFPITITIDSQKTVSRVNHNLHVDSIKNFTNYKYTLNHTTVEPHPAPDDVCCSCRRNIEKNFQQTMAIEPAKFKF